MRVTVGALTALLFFIWLLPLGIFIKPSQEKVACDGQRAICMCSVHFNKKAPSTPGKVMLACAAQGASKEAPSSGSASNYFLSNIPVMPVIDLRVSQWESPVYFPSLPIIQSVEHVPRF